MYSIIDQLRDVQPETVEPRFSSLYRQVKASVRIGVGDRPAECDPAIPSAAKLDALCKVSVCESVAIHIDKEPEQVPIPLVNASQVITSKCNRVWCCILFSAFSAEQFPQPINFSKRMPNSGVIVPVSGEIFCFPL